MRERRSRAARVLALALLCLLLAPITWWRQALPPADTRDLLAIERLEVAQPHGWPDNLRFLEAWELRSSNTAFGGYSALLALPQGRLAAYTDRSGALEFSMDKGRAADPRFGWVPGHPQEPWQHNDLESATRDPVSGRVWVAIESTNVVRRLAADGTIEAFAFPPAMKDWPGNSGAEAMLRLPDGRFIVLGESKARLSREAGPGLLFDGDPVEGAEVIEFRFVPPEGFHPTELALMPDGRVLILLRAFDLALPPFQSLLVVADPAAIQEGEPWPWSPLAELGPPLPRENYEGMATVPTADGGADIWIISDNNNYAVLQRTLLLKLHWSPASSTQKGAPVKPGTP